MNPNQIRLIGKGLLSIVIASRLVEGHINAKRCNRNAEKIRLLKEQNEQLRSIVLASVEQTDYLISKLNEAGIPATEFDNIVLNSLNTP